MASRLSRRPSLRRETLSLSFSLYALRSEGSSRGAQEHGVIFRNVAERCRERREKNENEKHVTVWQSFCFSTLSLFFLSLPSLSSLSLSLPL